MLRFYVSVILTAIALVPLSGQVESKTIPEKLGKTKTSYTIRADSLGAALMRFSADWEIPAGIIWTVNSDTNRPILKTFQYASGEEVLRELLADFPGYKVRHNNQSLCISPIDEEGDAASFLNLRIDHFEASEEFLDLARARLRREISSKLKPVLRSASPKRGGIGSSLAVGLGDRKVSVRASDVPVVEILRMLAVSAGETSFIVTYPEDDSYTDLGYRRTINFLGRKSPPDDQQPSILFLPWTSIPALIPEATPGSEVTDP